MRGLAGQRRDCRQRRAERGKGVRRSARRRTGWQRAHGIHEVCCLQAAVIKFKRSCAWNPTVSEFAVTVLSPAERSIVTSMWPFRAIDVNTVQSMHSAAYQLGVCFEVRGARLEMQLLGLAWFSKPVRNWTEPATVNAAAWRGGTAACAPQHPIKLRILEP